MDLPKGVEMGWQQLLRINGSEAEFYEKNKAANERNVIRFMLIDESYSSSLFSSLSSARENIRTSRELLPDEAWEQVNELYLFVKNDLETVVNRRSRVLFLKKILEGCQRFTGLLSGYMSHHHPYRFIRLGRNLERADMTSRILDLASLLLADSRSDELRQYETILWMNILTALNALLMYRQHVRSRVKGDDVLNFLLLDKCLPRAVARCLVEMSACIQELPNNDGLPTRVIELEAYVQSIDTREATQLQLRAILDDLQNKLGSLHGHIADNWFSRVATEV
jgi:uncharacterized alpha-E superfamily protein